MNIIRLLATRYTFVPVFIVLAQMSLPVSAQQQTLDFFGEVNDNDHQAGYREYIEQGCWQCHGFQGQGMAGPALAPNPLPYEAFATLVRKPANVMPAYSPALLSDEQMRRIHQYLQSIPPAPDPDSLPLLSVE